MDNYVTEISDTEIKHPVLSVKNLSKSFGTRTVLDNISFDIQKGEIFGLLGPNGSGKTTTIKLALGLLNIDSGCGSVNICGYDIKNNFEKAIRNVGAIIENPEMYKNLTGRQNLMQYFRMYDDCDMETLEWAIKSVGLQNRIDDKVSKYSLGMRQRLGIAQALLHSPKLLILDEPTNGLDPEGIKKFREFLLYLAHEKGISVLISSHMLAELDNLCDKVGVINFGKMVGIKTMEEIRNYNNGGMNLYRLVVNDCEKTSQYLNEKEIKYVQSADGAYSVSLTDEISETIVIDLVGLGVHIKAFSPIEKSLEDAFMQMVDKSGGSVI